MGAAAQMIERRGTCREIRPAASGRGLEAQIRCWTAKRAPRLYELPLGFVTMIRTTPGDKDATFGDRLGDLLAENEMQANSAAGSRDRKEASIN
jgi:hypothetical protein